MKKDIKNLSDLFKLNDGWEMINFSLPDEKSDEKYAEFKLIYTDKNNTFTFCLFNDNFIGEKARFYITVSEIYKTEFKDKVIPFKYIDFNIAKEYNKWFCNGIYYNELTENNNNEIDIFRMRAWENEEVDDEYSKKIYEKLIALGDEDSCFRYAKSLRKKGDFKKTIENIQKLIDRSIDIDKMKLQDLYFQAAISYFKIEKEPYSNAFSMLEQIKDIFIKNNDIDKLLFFFLLLRKMKRKDELEDYINTDDNLKNISNIIERNEKPEINGILIWIDLANSTEYKENGYKEWYERILYFLNMTTAIFNILGYDTLKYIGDEVMLFKELKPSKEKPTVNDHYDQAKILYDIFFDEQKWYFEEINRFNEKLTRDNPKREQERIKVKICISVVEYIIKINDLRSKDEKYDIYGSDVDKSARIKGLARDNLVVANARFVDLLNHNKGKYYNSFNEYTWKDKMKGISKEIKYYGKEVDQNIEFSWLKEDAEKR